VKKALPLYGGDPSPAKDFTPVEIATSPSGKQLPLTRRFMPSASSTDLLLACQWPFGRYVPRGGSSEEADYGTAFHKAIAERPQRGKEEEEPDHVRTTRAYVQEWLDGKNPWGVVWDEPMKEVSNAYDIYTRKWRPTTSPTEEDHAYLGAASDELPGTADLVSRAARKKENFRLILDYKTGYDVAGAPLESGQLLSLALAFSHPKERVVVGYIHTPKDGVPTIYADEVFRDRLDGHALSLKTAWGNIGAGVLKPGPWCKYCPARSICPTTTSALAELKAPQGQALTADRVGAIHQALATYEDLAKTLRANIRNWVATNPDAVATRPDGKHLEIRQKAFTNLSMSSIERALGKAKAADVIADLEKKGCVERGMRDELWAVPEKGK
jgi:hypothetical protein